MKQKTIPALGKSKVAVRHSMFYGYVFTVKHVKDVKPLLHMIRQQHKQANHVAYAYRLISQTITGQEDLVERGCDDGEPTKTAGAPLLSLLQHEEKLGLLLCVAREYGGVKLGRGGLRRAYQQAGEVALHAAYNKRENK